MRGGSAHRLALALGIAAGTHLLAWAVLADWRVEPEDVVTSSENTSSEHTPASPAEREATELTMVELATWPAAGLPEIPLSALRGPADETGARTHPDPARNDEIAGQLAASRGGGGASGATRFTGRRDQTTDVPIQREAWNGKRDYQSAHERSARMARSPEAVRQSPVQDVGDRAKATRVASAGAEQVSTGGAEAGRGPATIAPVGAPSTGGTAPAGTQTPAAHDGAMRPNPTPAQVEPGVHSTDVPVRGPTSTDDTNTAAASRERKPGPYEITPPSTGGPARTGVAGAPAPGQSTTGRASGTAQTPWGVAKGPRNLGIMAEAQDPYFRTMFARLGKLVVYPRNLALELRAGRPIAELTLRSDGGISRAAIAVPSGKVEFDRELVRAIGVLGRLPPPPASLLDGRSEIRVRIEWVFDPGILR